MSNPCALPSLSLPPTEADLRELPKLEERLRRKVGVCVSEYGLIEEGDRILVGLSGGKDSWACLDLLLSLQKRAPVRFEIHGATLDPGFPGYNPDRIAEVCEELKVPHTILSAPVDALVRKKPDITPCAICSRLRRGVLYTHAKTHGFTKIALGHHLDDLIETLLINQFYEGRLSTMPLKLISDDGANTVIRPLGTCEEEDLRRFAWLKGYPLVPCGCPLCGASVLESSRAQIKALVAQLQTTIPDLKYCLLRAMKNVKTTHLLDHALLALPEPPQAPKRVRMRLQRENA
ncbi:MAG: tRNA 2-thiocytidine(32) synthetase TtcA [Firmicutes bacterium]|nr:tRNA 2-thiocytidine(32) synthetase TtcA [Bacillota bacterium]